MKYLGFLFLLLSLARANAQDLIVTPERDSINCKITRVKDGYIYFTFKHKGEVRNTLIPEKEVIYQFGYYKTPDVAVEKKSHHGDYNQWHLEFNGGPAYRLAKIPYDLIDQEKDYLRELKSGYQFGLDASFFISELLGFGAKLSTFRSKHSQSDLLIRLPDGSSTTVAVSDDIKMFYAGPSVITRWVPANKKGVFNSDFSLGYLNFSNFSTLDGQQLQIKGATLGLTLGLGYDFYISKNFGVGLGIGFVLGTLTKVTLNDGNTTQTVKLEEGQYEGLSRIDLSVGLRVYH